ncbi:MAG TPA: hypothetical protein VHZ24_07150 [Pirellulales bacterium]|jgi:hypothetical protein|nr:hypothetical protein [Pirellulales bacterium]
MKTQLQSSMAAGVFVEFHDDQGNTLGQAVFTDWQGRPVPAVGDTLRCEAQSTITGRREQIVGQVTSRHFELQHDEGNPCIWVRLAATVAGAQRRINAPRFSNN